MPLILLAAAGLIVSVVLGSWFSSLYQRDRPEVVFGVLVGALLIESYLNSSASAVEEGGLFRPVVAGQDFRPPDLVIIVGVAVRVLQSRRTQQLTNLVLAWGAFLLWYAAAAYQGVANGNPTAEVLFHGKAVFYIFGCALLAAPIDLPRVLASPAFSRWRWWLGGVSAVFVLATLAGLRVSLRLPALPLPRAGTLNNDAITMVVGIGLIIAITMLSQQRRSAVLGLACAVMVAAPLAGGQRANFVGMAASVVVIVVAAVGRSWRRRITITPSELGVFFAAATLAGLVGIAFGGSNVDVLAKFDETFFNSVESQTAAVRVETWRQARELISERPVAGWGLGIEQNIGPVGNELWRTSQREAREISAHNLVFDVTLRTGVVGLTLLSGALLVTALAVIRVWRHHRDPATAGFVLAVGALLAGVMAKGMVESVFEKYRLTATIGIAVGLIAAGLRSLDSSTDLDADRRTDDLLGSRPVDRVVFGVLGTEQPRQQP